MVLASKEKKEAIKMYSLTSAELTRTQVNANNLIDNMQRELSKKLKDTERNYKAELDAKDTESQEEKEALQDEIDRLVQEEEEEDGVVTSILELKLWFLLS